MKVEPRVIPTLLVLEGALVKTRSFKDPVYVGDPVNVLSIFNSFEVDEIVLLDIGAARSRQPCDISSLREFAEECFIPLAYGGGLEDVETLRGLFSAGYEKAILNTALQESPDFVRMAVRHFGSQAIVASIDVQGSGDDRTVLSRSGTQVVTSDPVGWARHVEALGVGEILLTSIDREGQWCGFDLDLVCEIAEAVDVPVIAHGGASNRKDLAGPISVGASAVGAGSLFVFQRDGQGVLINYPSRPQIVRLLGL